MQYLGVWHDARGLPILSSRTCVVGTFHSPPRDHIFMDIISAVLRQKTSTNATPPAAGGSNLGDRSQKASDIMVTEWVRDSARGCVCRPFFAYNYDKYIHKHIVARGGMECDDIIAHWRWQNRLLLREGKLTSRRTMLT